ncbi:MAG: carboxypeptidase regulatory-like domain-containing protein [Verrucomicrobiota bacterium]
MPALLAALAIPAASVMAGTVTGTVPLPPRQAGRIPVEKYTGTISGKVAAPPPPCAGVWIEGPGISARAPAAKVALPQHGYQFARSLLVVSRGTTVEFPNNDNDFHNVFSLSRTKKFDAGRYKKSETPAPVVTFDKAGFVRVKCEIHDHMNAVVLVVDSPWFTVTDAAGKFALTGVPPGQYTLCAQLDEKSKWSASVTITSGSTSVNFSKPNTVP